MIGQGTITISYVDTGFTDLSWSRWQFAGEGELRTGQIQMNTRHEDLTCLPMRALGRRPGEAR